MRLKRGISQERLAELCTFHRNYVGAVERGENNLTLVNVGKLAAALGVTMAELFADVPTYEGLREEYLSAWKERDRSKLPPWYR